MGGRDPRHHWPRFRPSPRVVLGIAAVALVAAIGLVVGLASQPASTNAGTDRSAFAWLASSSRPPTFRSVRVPFGLGNLSVPPGFRPVEADPGALSVALFGSNGAYLGFLNATPRADGEFLHGWAAFRLAHLHGDEAVSAHQDAAVESIRIGRTVRSCVTDDYVTTVGHHPFHEVACLVTTGSNDSVVVAATPAGDPAHVWKQLERAVAAYPS
jgi:hypothetical protein